MLTQLVGNVIEANLLPCKRVCCEDGRQSETTGMGSNPIHILNCFRSVTITGVVVIDKFFDTTRKYYGSSNR